MSQPAAAGRVTILFCHGSRAADWRVPFEQLADDYRQRFPDERGRLLGLVARADRPGMLPRAVAEVERIFARRIELVAKQEYHIEQFDLAGG